MYAQSGYQHFTEYAIWLITIVLVAFGFRYAKDLISLVLDKLYQFFIQQNLSL